jgi:hypothetical protein
MKEPNPINMEGKPLEEFKRLVFKGSVIDGSEDSEKKFTSKLEEQDGGGWKTYRTTQIDGFFVVELKRPAKIN